MLKFQNKNDFIFHISNYKIISKYFNCSAKADIITEYSKMFIRLLNFSNPRETLCDMIKEKCCITKL